MVENNSGPPKENPIGLPYWMERVLEEVDGARRNLTVDRVHDLRVALRRCRSMAEGFMGIDPDKTWKSLQREGRQLFRRLGQLRDLQVLGMWIHSLGDPVDPVSLAMLAHMGQQEQGLERAAADALLAFNDTKWRRWISKLGVRARNLPVGGAVFQLSALQAWIEARNLHVQAMRNRSDAAYHRLRIGIKKFRYTVENFLPLLHAEWGRDLKDLQDGIGEAHDLCVFWQTALRIRAFPDRESRERWRDLIAKEKARRLECYRVKMVGKGTLWETWRQKLPPQTRLHALSLTMVEKWASLHGINIARARRVRRLALQLFDGLQRGKRTAEPEIVKSRRTALHMAAILHELGRPKGRKGNRQTARSLLRTLPTAPGLTEESLRCAAIVIRYHRGKIRDLDDADYAALPESQRQPVMELCGILRLARVLARGERKTIDTLKVQVDGNSIIITAPGFSAFGPRAEKVARARYLLEVACVRPVIIRGLPDNQAATADESANEKPTPSQVTGNTVPPSNPEPDRSI